MSVTQQKLSLLIKFNLKKKKNKVQLVKFSLMYCASGILSKESFTNLKGIFKKHNPTNSGRRSEERLQQNFRSWQADREVK